MSSKANDYDHMNATDPVKVSLSLETLASELVHMNYGVHRFLSALVRERRMERLRTATPGEDALMKAIEDKLNEGCY